MFLDRDGVLNQAIVREGKPYPPASLAETVLVNGAADSLARLKKRNFLLIVVTNQPDIRRGTASKQTLDEIHAFLAAELPLDDLFVCCHTDEDACSCRKPKPGLILEAANRHAIDLQRSYLIGDRWRDIDAGAAAGCRTIFIDHRYNERDPETLPDIRVSALSEAVDRILEEVDWN